MKIESIKPAWFSEFTWLVYSPLKRGLFAPAPAGGVRLGRLVQSPCCATETQLSKAVRYFKNHACDKYHTASVEKSIDFSKLYKSTESVVIDCITSHSNELYKPQQNFLNLLCPLLICAAIAG